MGNCTSKKSRKSLKLSTKKTLFLSKMDKEQDTYPKGLSKKIVPFTKGEVTSFGFKKKLSSQLPVPITLTSNGHSVYESNDKIVQNGAANHKNISEGYQSGSSVESLCHATFRSTPKMVRKSRDLVKQVVHSDLTRTEPNSNSSSLKSIKTSINVPTSLALRNENSSSSNGKITSESSVNRFGFRQPTPPRATNNTGKGFKTNGHITRTAFLTCQDPHETGSHFTTKKLEVSSRSRSEGSREAFFKQNLQPANSVQSGLNQSKTSVSNLQPGKFTFQTSHLPRPQFAIRMSDPKTAKTAANYYRKGEVRSDFSSNEDSGFESHQSANNTLEKQIEILDSSPGSKVRRRLPAFKGKKLEMKIVGNKFELLKRDEETSPDVVTEVSLIKLPPTNMRTNTGTTIINTGLVEQRTNQYLKKISQSFNKKDFDVGVSDPSKIPQKPNPKITVDSSNRDEGLGAESEEEKLFKDSRKSEKSSLRYSMSDGCGDGEDMLPGETMAEDVNLCLSFEEETSSGSAKKISEKPVFMSGNDVTPNTIRLDALKLSKELKYKNTAVGMNRKGNDSTAEFLAACEKDEDTFPSDSILEQLSDSDSLGDKNENKNNDKEKNIKIAHLDLDKEDLGIEIDEEENLKSDTDVDENYLELNIDESENKDKNCLGTASPDSPGTPTHASNSLSLSDGRDFLIDDEIADQPQLCMSESYVDCSCQEEAKTTNEKTMTVNNEFVTCCDVQTNTVESGNEVENLNHNDQKVREFVDIEVTDKAVNGEERRRLHSEGTLSPCDSITSDDLMLDFETNSLEETGVKFDVNDNVSVENLDISTGKDEIFDVSCHRLNAGSGGEKPLKTKEGGSDCSTPASAKSSEVASRVCSPYRSSRSSPADDEPIKLDKISYQNMFQDIIGIKAMLLKLKRLLLESEGGLRENGRIYPDIGTLDNAVEDELTDLRRQVLFLQQQLEEREKMVQVLRLKMSQTSESKTTLTDSKKSNAATQTGLDQFQQDFPHFRIFQTTPVV